MRLSGTGSFMHGIIDPADDKLLLTEVALRN